ncbi:MAG: transcriptional regulator, partial [Methanothrix sp.]|nr:transcriptional regulator [Methanothrix sp.]
SQYVSKKRGYSIEFDDDVKAAISRLADDMIQNNADDLSERICQICKMARGDELVCEMDKSKCD